MRELDPKYTFEQFANGRQVRGALACATRAALEPKTYANPLILYGESGLGKTHLMHAIGHRLQGVRADSRVVYAGTERLVRDLAKGVRDVLGLNGGDVAAVLLDDIHFLSSRRAQQRAIAGVLAKALWIECQVVITCDRHPREFDDWNSALRDVFEQGTASCVGPSDFEHRLAIINMKSAWNSLNLSDDVARSLASRMFGNCREIEGMLHRLQACSQIQGWAVDADFVVETLGATLARYSAAYD